MNKKRKIIIAVSAIIALCLILAGSIIWSNEHISVEKYSVEFERLPEEFDGFKIAQVSDLHNATLGKEHSRLIKAIKKSSPDIIVLTGDMIDSYSTDIENSIDFIKQAVDIAPCYYVPGNHEARLTNEYPVFAEKISALGVKILENAETFIEKENGSKIQIAGVIDPMFVPHCDVSHFEGIMKGYLDEISDYDGFTLLLAHRPEILKVYAEKGVDLVLSGHTHGGQVRIPFIGAIYCPNQGIFPEYSDGFYSLDDTVMFISRGMGSSSFPVRIFNPPQLVIITLEHAD